VKQIAGNRGEGEITLADETDGQRRIDICELCESAVDRRTFNRENSVSWMQIRDVLPTLDP